MLIGFFYSQIVESSSLVSVPFQEAISHPCISFFHLLVNVFSVTSFRTFSKTPYLYYTGGRGEIKMTSAKINQSSERPHFNPHSTAKTNDKSTNLRKNGIYWYKWCNRFSILRENPYEEVDDENDYYYYYE